MSSFFARILRMKYIDRWGLMRNTWKESLSEHTLDVAILAHGLAVINNRRFEGTVSPEHVATLALFHDANEIITGDLPTPVKYHDDRIRTAYKQLEEGARQDLLNLLPEDLRPDYAKAFQEDLNTKEWQLVKAADKLSALIKCMEEEQAGNDEFSVAKQAQLDALHHMNVPEAHVFLEEFIPAFALTLDEQ